MSPINGRVNGLDSGEGRDWLDEHGLPRNPYYAPERECTANDPQPNLGFALTEGETVTASPLVINGSAYADNGFRSWRLDYGLGDNPDSWSPLNESNNPIQDGTLYIWDLSSLQSGIITLRLTLVGKQAEVEKRVHLTLVLPTPTVLPSLRRSNHFPLNADRDHRSNGNTDRDSNWSSNWTAD